MKRRELLGKPSRHGQVCALQRPVPLRLTVRGTQIGPNSGPALRRHEKGTCSTVQFGRTGSISAFGLGGHHIGLVKEVQDSIKLIRSAIDRGITFMDNCWDYHNGKE